LRTKNRNCNFPVCLGFGNNPVFDYKPLAVGLHGLITTMPSTVICSFVRSLSIAACLCFALLACTKSAFEEIPVPSDPGISSRTYPLDKPREIGFSGTFSIKKLTDGTSRGELRINGCKSGFRYFGKISASNASDDNNITDIADLAEIAASTGTSNSWLEKDYDNNRLLFDSLLTANAMVRILELDTKKNQLVEVLRGDIGSNTLLPDSVVYNFDEVNQSGISGKLVIRQRVNGNFIAVSQFSGLGFTTPKELSFYTGNYASSNFSKLNKISSITENQTEYTFGIPWYRGTIHLFDTLKGFIGIELSGDVPVLQSICNFGGNKSTGNQYRYNLYNPGDSSVAGNILFEEIGAAGSPLQLTFSSSGPNDGVSRYLTFHRGTTLDPTDSIMVRKVSNAGTTVFQNISDGNGGYLTYQKLLQWNANARLVEDPIGFSNVTGSADIGLNEIDNSDSIVRSLSTPSPDYPTFSGTLIFRPRKSGKVILHIRLSEAYAGVENSIAIKQGPVPATFIPYQESGTLFKVIFNGTSVGQSVKETHDVLSASADPAIWQSVKSAYGQGNYVEHNFSDDFVYPLSRGPF
jgi:hypothetical protein